MCSVNIPAAHTLKLCVFMTVNTLTLSFDSFLIEPVQVGGGETRSHPAVQNETS